tara:strand:- start:250 stop:879 length:630 start_codon:yes stop_codon:yes gene_type:complete
MKILELFKGSGSITKYFIDNNDVEVISLDILEKYNPTICSDIMTFDYKQFDIGYFDIIWASPECKIFSQLQHTHIGKKWNSLEHLKNEREKNKIYINKTIEIIDYLKPTYYFIENPLYSKIWDYIDNKNYIDNYVIVDYCYFGYNYKKPTKILTNKILENKRCSCKKHNMRLGITGKNIKNGLTDNMIKDNTTLNQRYSIPQKLLDYLF